MLPITLLLSITVREEITKTLNHYFSYRFVSLFFFVCCTWEDPIHHVSVTLAHRWQVTSAKNPLLTASVTEREREIDRSKSTHHLKIWLSFSPYSHRSIKSFMTFSSFYLKSFGATIMWFPITVVSCQHSCHLRRLWVVRAVHSCVLHFILHNGSYMPDSLHISCLSSFTDKLCFFLHSNSWFHSDTQLST